jgi:hypothetical protein
MFPLTVNTVCLSLYPWHAPIRQFCMNIALEGITESLAAELDPAWNIKVLRIIFRHCRSVRLTLRLDHTCGNGLLSNQFRQKPHLLSLRASLLHKPSTPG